MTCLLAAVTNYDLTTMAYQGQSWQERLATVGDMAAQLAAARVGARFGTKGAKFMDRKAHEWGWAPCFVAGTPIRKLDGSVAIEQLRAGDVVLSRDEYDATGEVTGRRVEEVFVRRALVMAVGVAGREIETTEGHPFWVVGRGWTAANEVVVGDRVLSASGEELRVESVGESRREAVVYNFRVEELHTYFVGDPAGWGFDVWVHNDHIGQRLEVSKGKYPESAKHIEDAQASGKPSTLTIDRTGADARRKAAMKGHKTKDGHDRDEYPPAMFKEGGSGASVKHIGSSDNRGSGSTMGHKLQTLPDGTTIEVVVVP